MDVSKYTALFLQEIQENTAKLSQLFVELEKNPKDAKTLGEIMQYSHSCKGSMRTMNFTATGELFHSLEDVFDGARKGELEITPDIIDVCLEGLDAINDSLESIKDSGAEKEYAELAQKIHQVISTEQNSEVKPEPKPSTDAKPQEIQKEKPKIEKTEQTVSHIRVDAKKLDSITNLAGEFSLLRQQFESLQQVPAVLPLLEQYDRLLNSLMFTANEIRLVPLEQAFTHFPRLVRDLAKEQGKKIDLEIHGADLELDKTLVDHLLSPMIHLLRNAVDHGIESPEVREQSGKPETATIQISVKRSEGFVSVTVEDDGATISSDTLKPIALKRGIPKEELDHINDENVLDLLCDDRFSSKETVTDISGRGVGLSAVREAADSIGGHLQLIQQNGKKKFVLLLPLRLSIIQSLLIQSAKETYAIPLLHVRKLLNINAEDVKNNMGEPVMIFEEQDVPLIYLSHLLGKKVEKNACDIHGKTTNVVLIEIENSTIGIVVDSILGNKDILVKPISHAVENVDYFSGSTILGNGKVSLILDILKVIAHQKKKIHTPPTQTPSPDDHGTS